MYTAELLHVYCGAVSLKYTCASLISYTVFNYNGTFQSANHAVSANRTVLSETAPGNMTWIE